MATRSVREIVWNCLGKSGYLSLKEDVFGVYSNDHPQDRSLKSQLYLIQNKPFVRVGLVVILSGTVMAASANDLQQQVDCANEVYQADCGVWIYCEYRLDINRPGLIQIQQNDCQINGHNPSGDEAALFALGRNMGADIVCYFIDGSQSAGTFGCAAHPAGDRGFWVGNANWATTADKEYIFAHELGHVVGDNRHTIDDLKIANNDTDNLMYRFVNGYTNLPPDLENVQCKRIHNDPAIETFT